MSNLTIAIEKRENWQIISISGSIVVRSLSDFRKAFESVEQDGCINVAIDMSGTSNIDSSAITMLINAQKRLALANGQLVIFNATEEIEHIFSIVNLQETIPLFNSKADFENSMQKNVPVCS